MGFTGLKWVCLPHIPSKPLKAEALLLLQHGRRQETCHCRQFQSHSLALINKFGPESQSTAWDGWMGMP